MDNDTKLNKEDVDMVAGGAGDASADIPEPKYNVGDHVIYKKSGAQLAGLIKGRYFDPNHQWGFWMYNILDWQIPEYNIVGYNPSYQ